MMLHPGRSVKRPIAAGLLAALGVLIGCASPGSPRPASLQLPAPVRDLTAIRSGDEVQIRFTVPARTTDGQAIRGDTVTGVLCRQDTAGHACRVADEEQTRRPLKIPAAGTTSGSVTWVDVLPAELASGPVRAVGYRVELKNAEGRTAGYSDTAYAAAGQGPATVEGFVAKGVRPGVLLGWQSPSGRGELKVKRERLNAVSVQGKHETPPAESKGAMATQTERTREKTADAVTWLQPANETAAVPQMIDGSVEEGVPYRYTAVRTVTARVGGRTLELRSAPSAAVEIVWHDVYPPAPPAGLTALGYQVPPSNGSQAEYAVDLVWEPADDPRVTGYVVTRQRLDAAGSPVGSAKPLTAQPVSTPGFHDTSAVAGLAYRYSVTAVDAKGNASAPAVAVVKGQATP